MQIRITGRSQVSPGSDITGNPEEQRQELPSPTMPTASTTTPDIAAPLNMANVASLYEAPQSELSVEQVETDITAVLTEMDTLIGKVNDYKVKVCKMNA